MENHLKSVGGICTGIYAKVYTIMLSDQNKHTSNFKIKVPAQKRKEENLNCGRALQDWRASPKLRMGLI